MEKTTMDYFASKGFPLYAHQQKSLNFFMKIETEQGKGGILADDMGLGKTIQALSLIHCNQLKNTLICVPSGVIQEWVGKIHSILDENTFNLVIHYGPKRVKIKSEFEKLLDDTKKNIVITSHHSMWTRKKGIKRVFIPTVLHDIEWDRLVVDESHIVRNNSTILFKGLDCISKRYTWMLSGTPVQNSLRDIGNLFRLIGILDTNSRKNIERLCETNLMRRTKQEIAREREEMKLPELHIENLNCKFICEDEEKFYKSVSANTRNTFQRLLTSGKSFSINNMLEMFLRLKQATIHPQLVIDGYKKKGVFARSISDWDGDTTKFHYLIRTMNEEKHTNQKTIIFTKFTKEIDMLYEKIKKNGFTVGIFDGRTTYEQRKDIIEKRFVPDVLLIQINAGGCGLNLQEYSRVFIISPDWNPSNEFQAIARAHRNGQLKTVKVSRLLLQYRNGDDTLDHHIIRVQKRKADLHAEILKDRDLLNVHKYEIKKINNELNVLTLSNFKELLL